MPDYPWSEDERREAEQLRAEEGWRKAGGKKGKGAPRVPPCGAASLPPYCLPACCAVDAT